MKIIVNGEERFLETEILITDYVRSLDLDPATVVVEVDGRIINRREYQSTLLLDGAEVELIRFIGGGAGC
ncbi:sulfur carrier protein ThiS [Desulfobacterota bacterium M19]